MSIDYASEIRSRAKKATESVRQMDLDHHLNRLDHAVSMWLGSEDAKLTACYASGRKDEREEWAPILAALKLILPLAKGYAHAHPVGSNAWYVEQAAEAIARVEAP
jgi:hypothetical protein